MSLNRGRLGQVLREEREISLHKGYTGTLRWMAPEVLGDFTAYTEKVLPSPTYGVRAPDCGACTMLRGPLHVFRCA